MVRAPFLKYSLQCRIGLMDGVFVMYHNTSEVFGYEYISLAKMDQFLFGSSYFGDLAYSASLQMFNGIFSRIVEDFGDCAILKISLGTVDLKRSVLFVEALNREELLAQVSVFLSVKVRGVVTLEWNRMERTRLLLF